MNHVRTNQQLMVVLIAVLSLMALYTLAGSSDRIEGLTVQEQQQVVARWR